MNCRIDWVAKFLIIMEKMQSKFYKVTAVPVLLYGSDTWILILQKLQITEIKFIRLLRDCTRFVRFVNHDAREELGVSSFEETIYSCRGQ